MESVTNLDVSIADAAGEAAVVAAPAAALA
jgi:hypothetical protein